MSMPGFNSVSRDVRPSALLIRLSKLANVPLFVNSIEQSREFVQRVIGLLEPQNGAMQKISTIADAAGQTSEIIFGAHLRDSRPPIWIGPTDLRYPPHACAGKIKTMNCPPFRRFVLNNGCIAKFSRFGPIIFDKNRCLVADVSTPYAPFVQYYDWDVVQESRHWRKVRGTAIVLMDCLWSVNYCHWFLDNLVRLCAVDRERPYSVICSSLHYRWQRELLRLAGVPPARIIELEDFDGVIADELIVPDNLVSLRHPVLSCHPQAFKFLQSLILPFLGPGPWADKSADVTLISRRASGTRCLVDETSLCNLLTKKNISFDVVELEDLSVVEQLKLFWRSKAVVAVHGAGLANAIAMASGAKVFELIPPSHFTPVYYSISGQNNLSYYAVTGLEVVGEDRRPGEQDIALGPEKAKVLVNHLLNISNDSEA